MKIEDIKEINMDELSEMLDNGTIRYHHTSYFRGYVSRTADIKPIPYKGHFGEGYKLEKPNWNSTTYSFVSYFVFTDKARENR